MAGGIAEGRDCGEERIVTAGDLGAPRFLEGDHIAVGINRVECGVGFPGGKGIDGLCVGIFGIGSGVEGALHDGGEINALVYGPGEEVEEDGRIAGGCSVHFFGQALQGFIDDDIGGVSCCPELVAGVFVGGFQAGARKDVVELIVEEVFPGFGQSCFGVGFVELVGCQ